MRKVKSLLALLLCVVMVLSLAACEKKNPTAVPPTEGPTEVTKAPTATPVPPMKITVSLPSDNEHVADGSNDNEMQWYNKLVKEINEYTNMDITWEWLASATYYDAEHLGLKLSTSDVADVLVVGKDTAFLQAAEAGLFWDLAPYVDKFDNLATIPQATRENASYNGKMYGIPRSRTLARNGLGYRKDWLEKLNLAEPTTWDNFKAMLEGFTHGDPDGDGVDNTFGLGLDSWAGVFDIMGTWFGVPNEWGLKDGKLIYKVETEEYITALKAFRELYSEGLINDGSVDGIPDFRDVKAGGARGSIMNNQFAGCGVQVLDDQRKIETNYESLGISDPDDPIYTLQGYVLTESGKNQPLCYPTTGMNNMIAISTKNVKTEEQLLQVLSFIDKVNDGVLLNLIEYGWKDITYKIDDDGYVALISDADELKANGVESTKYNFGFNQVIPYFTAEKNARPADRNMYTTAITKLEQQLYAEDIQYCVPNYGASYTAPTYVAIGGDLATIISDAQLKFIVGEIDESALREAIKTWKQSGGDTVTKEMNDLYQAAQKKK